jgi:hypothetical protein
VQVQPEDMHSVRIVSCHYGKMLVIWSPPYCNDAPAHVRLGYTASLKASRRSSCLLQSRLQYFTVASPLMRAHHL